MVCVTVLAFGGFYELGIYFIFIFLFFIFYFLFFIFFILPLGMQPNTIK